MIYQINQLHSAVGQMEKTKKVLVDCRPIFIQ